MNRHTMHISKSVHLTSGMKSAAAYTFASLFSKGLSFITIPIFTRIMSTAEIGTVNLYNSWQSMLTVIATLALTYGGYMVALREFEHERDQYQSAVLTLTSLVAVVLFIVFSVAPDFWSQLIGLDKSLLVLMLIGFLVSPATEFWLARQRYEYRYVAASIVTIVSAILASALSVITVLTLNNQNSSHAAEGRLFANFAVLYIVAFVLWCYILVRGRTFICWKYWKFSLALSLPLIANQFAMQIMNNSGKIMIGWFADKSAVGIYGTLASISTICTIIWSALNTSFVPFLYKNLSEQHGRIRIRKLSQLLLLTYAFACMLIVYLAPEAIKLLATEEYYDAIYIMPVIAAAIFQNAVSNLYSNVLLYHKKSSYIMISSAIGAIMNIVLNYLLIPLFGYPAAAYSMLLAYMLLSYSQMIVSNRLHKTVTQSNETVYNDKTIIVIQWILIILSVLAIPLYNFYLVRYIAFFLIAGICFALFMVRHKTNFA